MLKQIKYILLLFILFGCVETPEPDINDEKAGNYIVLSEGLLGQNNSKLALINLEKNIINSQYYEQINNQQLGDNANDMIIVGNNIYIIVSQSNKIIKINKNTGKIISENILDKNRFMKRIYFDEYIYISDLLNNSLLKVDTASLSILKEINTGPGPDGIASNERYIFVANSAVGQFKDNEKGARTISFINKITGVEEKQLLIGPNTTNIIVLNNLLIASYANFHWEDGKIDGLIFYDLISNQIIKEIKCDITSKIVLNKNKIYFINKSGLNSLNINDYSIKNELQNTTTNIWYSFNIIDDVYFILNAKNHQVPGELLIFDNQNKIANFTTGLNPNTILKLN